MPCVWTLFDKQIDESVCSCLKKSLTVWTRVNANSVDKSQAVYKIQ